MDFFEILDLNKLNDAPVVQQKPVTKVRIRAYSPEYYEWIGQQKEEPAVVEVPDQAIKLVEQLTACTDPNCVGGIWHGAKYSRPCFRCGGKGHMTNEDTARYEARELARGMGIKKMSYSMHDNANWDFRTH